MLGEFNYDSCFFSTAFSLELHLRPHFLDVEALNLLRVATWRMKGVHTADGQLLGAMSNFQAERLGIG